jgi:hypothetical protein
VTDFAANIHFRVSAPVDFAGGYCWLLGRYRDWSAFEAEIRRALDRRGFYYVECLTLMEISGLAVLSDAEQRQLYGQLSTQPIQFCKLHTYQRDDA